MFDDVTQEPADMFSEIDANAPQISAPTMTLASSEPMAPGPDALSTTGRTGRMDERASSSKSIPWKAIIFVVMMIVVIGLAFFLAMRILKPNKPVIPAASQTAVPSTQAPVPTVNTQTSQQATPSATLPVPAATTPAVTTAPAPSATTIDPNLDSDHDGLTDLQEAQLGTNPNNPDTDADGLSDREEVNVYHTNPLNPDTDGDGFKDGDEVKNGYNPNGPGKLLVIPAAK